MSKLMWDKTGERYYETGVEKGVLYPCVNGAYPSGVVWNGLTAVTESPSGAEPNPHYADDIKYLNLMSAEEFGATVEAYTYPDEFAECDGSAEIASGVTIGQQKRKTFGLSYVTKLGNDVDGSDYGYKLHLIYGALASPSERNYATINDSPEAITFSWEVTTTPVEVSGFKPTASVTIDSTKVDAEQLAALEAILYGSDSEEARLPLPDEIMSLFDKHTGIEISVEPDSDGSNRYGKSVSELQSDIVISGDTINGTLKYVTGYTGFSSVTGEQSGNYLSLKINQKPLDAVVKVELVGGTTGERIVNDGYIVCRITDEDAMTLKITAEKSGYEGATKVYKLTGLTLETE